MKNSQEINNSDRIFPSSFLKWETALSNTELQLKSDYSK